jgi:rhodanese-related sulfurtransferase
VDAGADDEDSLGGPGPDELIGDRHRIDESRALLADVDRGNAGGAELRLKEACGARKDGVGAQRREEDHVDAIELAEWLRDQKAGLRVIDVRPAEEYQEYHIPTSKNVPLAGITDLVVKPGETVVLYSEGGTHAAQAWFFLKAQGAQNVYFLKDGLNDWFNEVMNPSLPLDVRTRELVEYFGGEPTSDSTASAVTVQDRVKRLKRRTC